MQSQQSKDDDTACAQPATVGDDLDTCAYRQQQSSLEEGLDLKGPLAFPEDNQVMADKVTAVRAHSSLLQGLHVMNIAEQGIPEGLLNTRAGRIV